MSQLRNTLSLALALMLSVCTATAKAEKPAKDTQAEKAPGSQKAEPPVEAIIWTSHKARSLFAVDLKGDRLKNVYSENDGADCVVADLKTNRLYTSVWTDGPPDGHKIREIETATGKTRDVITGRSHIVDIALDHEKGKLYWTCMDTGELQRGNIDGTKVETFVTGLNRPDELAIDEKTGKIYWTEQGGGRVGVINRDGKGRKLLFNSLPGIMGIAIDNQHGRFYGCLRTPGEIFSSKLDGTDRKTVLKVDANADGIALDVPRNLIYWMDQGGIHSAHLDGSDAKEIVLGGNSPYGTVLLVPEMPNLLDAKPE